MIRKSEFEDKYFEALTLHEQGKPSIKLYRYLIEQEQNNSVLNYLLSAAYHTAGDTKNSKKFYKIAVNLNSNVEFSENYRNLPEIIKLAYGLLSSKINPYKNADFEKTLNLKPVFDSVYSNVASLYRGVNDLSNTLRICEDGLAQYPDSRFIKWIYGGALIKTRFMQEGWKYFDDRVEEFYHLPEDLAKKEIFNFQETTKPIYVHYSGGLGDTIFMARYLPLFKERNIDIICEPQKSMQRLFKASGFEYVDRTSVKPEIFDYRISFLNLPSLFKTSRDAVPYPDGFLKADEKDVKDFREKYFKTDRKKIGIVWNTGKNDIIRKIELKNLIPLFKNKKYQFYSLQHEITGEERDILKRNNVINIGEEFKDWEDTAAALSNLDIYIGCDTSVSNLAGALGIKSYILVLDFCEWRWDTIEETTPWFTSTKVYRQKIHGDWSDVIKRLQLAIK